MELARIYVGKNPTITRCFVVDEFTSTRGYVDEIIIPTDHCRYDISKPTEFGWGPEKGSPRTKNGIHLYRIDGKIYAYVGSHRTRFLCCASYDSSKWTNDMLNTKPIGYKVPDVPVLKYGLFDFVPVTFMSDTDLISAAKGDTHLLDPVYAFMAYLRLHNIDNFDEVSVFCKSYGWRVETPPSYMVSENTKVVHVYLTRYTYIRILDSYFD